MPVVYVTGFPDLVDGCRGLGTVLHKPVSLQALEAAIRAALAG